MTRRDLQNDMKKQGRPWCIGRAFDQSAPIGPITQEDQHDTDKGRGHAAGDQQQHPGHLIRAVPAPDEGAIEGPGQDKRGQKKAVGASSRESHERS
jgi:hypothetical protein